MTRKEADEYCFYVYCQLFSYGGLPSAWTRMVASDIRDKVAFEIPFYSTVAAAIEQHVLEELQK